MRLPAVAFVLIGLALGANASLGVGDKAPPIKVASYVKGATVSLEKGLHVVEFWATWCGPCKESIPHLTELAKQFKGKADFTGISISEQGPDQLGQVKKFVKTMGDSMAYNVAIDTDSKYMSQHWMDAAGQEGIPTAFVVRDGVILWIGHPMMGLGETLGKVTAGKFSVAQAKADAVKAKAEVAAQQKMAAEQQEAIQPYMVARQAGDLDGELKALDNFKLKFPQMKQQVDVSRAEVLLSKGAPEGYELADSISTSTMFKDSPEVLNMLAWAIVQPKPAAKHPVYKFAVKLAQHAVYVTHEADPTVLDTYALALFKAGDKAKAVEAETKALEIVKKAGDPSAAEYQKRLDEFSKS